MGFPARRRDRPSESQVSPKAAWYDRNPTSVQQYFQTLGAAPHSLTTRWTYTVPTGKKVFVEALFLKVQRITAATAAARPAAYIELNVGAGFYFQWQVDLVTNGVGDKDVLNAGQTLTLSAGNQLRAEDADGSTGGTVDYTQIVKVTAFDA